MEVVTSPTYTIISEYAGRFQFIHVDLYRINSEEEYDQLALSDLMNHNTVVVIEWPERAGTSLPEESIAVEIVIEANGDRTVIFPDLLTGSREEGASD